MKLLIREEWKPRDAYKPVRLWDRPDDDRMARRLEHSIARTTGELTLIIAIHRDVRSAG
ncbi:hypothetical protein M404DRAFT_992013 [Pisolithus tinctorius Marx 270]|uniref:Uncharacterized protein n=1 Tax=Pisolithus tinctorius Marx 270 TaxID=870435 RepID=A0A0C3PLU0_PISTI|nr:hypothetical protein M404DRAFT_992013 [Pisolithus tinctorius Marx 270]